VSADAARESALPLLLDGWQSLVPPLTMTRLSGVMSFAVPQSIRISDVMRPPTAILAIAVRLDVAAYCVGNDVE
jgi:hypothetical protein